MRPAMRTLREISIAWVVECRLLIEVRHRRLRLRMYRALPSLQSALHCRENGYSSSRTVAPASFICSTKWLGINSRPRELRNHVTHLRTNFGSTNPFLGVFHFFPAKEHVKSTIWRGDLQLQLAWRRDQFLSSVPAEVELIDLSADVTYSRDDLALDHL